MAPTHSGSILILQTYSWRLNLGGKDPDTVMTTMRELAARLVRVRPVLRGMKLEMLDNGQLHISLRVAGLTRWHVQADARKLIVMFLRRVFITPANIELELVTTERNGRELYLGEGRTPMIKRPRDKTKPDGSPWDDIEWWGDELPTLKEEDESAPGQDPATEHPSVPEVAPWEVGTAWTPWEVGTAWTPWARG